MAKIRNLIYEIFLIIKANYLIIPVILLLVLIIPVFYINSHLGIEKTELRASFSDIFTLLLSISIINWNITCLNVWHYSGSNEYYRSIKGYFVYPRIIFASFLFFFISVPSYLAANSAGILFFYDFIRFLILQIFLTILTYCICLISKSVTLTVAIMLGYVFMSFVPGFGGKNNFWVLSVYKVGTAENFSSYYLYVFLISILVFIMTIIYERKFLRYYS